MGTVADHSSNKTLSMRTHFRSKERERDRETNAALAVVGMIGRSLSPHNRALFSVLQTNRSPQERETKKTTKKTSLCEVRGRRKMSEVPRI